MSAPLDYTALSFLAVVSPWDSWTLSIDYESREIATISLVQKTWISLSARECCSLEKKFSEFHIDEWSEKYEKPVCDGFRWNLTLYIDDKEVKDISGANDYPPSDQWRPFIKLMENLYERTLKLGKTEVFPSLLVPYGRKKSIKTIMHRHFEGVWK